MVRMRHSGDRQSKYSAPRDAFVSDLDPVHTLPGIFENGDFFAVFKKSASICNVFESYLTVYTYTRIWFKNARLHACALLNI